MKKEKSLLDIEQMLREGSIQKAHEELLKLLDREPDNDSAWYMLGGLFRREQRWGEAINALNRARYLNPDGPAAHAIDSIYEILRFQNNDLMNP